MADSRKARAVGINHVALVVGDIEEALAFYGRLFEFDLRGKSDSDAFIDLGDQFLALQKGEAAPAATSASSSRTRRRSAAGWRNSASSRCQGASWTSSIPGAIESRSSAIPTSSSRRRRTCCAAWGSSGSPSRRRP